MYVRVVAEKHIRQHGNALSIVFNAGG